MSSARCQASVRSRRYARESFLQAPQNSTPRHARPRPHSSGRGLRGPDATVFRVAGFRLLQVFSAYLGIDTTTTTTTGSCPAAMHYRRAVHLRHSDANGRGTVWNPGRLLLGAGRPERSAIGTEQEQGIRSRLLALVRQQHTEQMSAALRPGRPSGRAAAVGS